MLVYKRFCTAQSSSRSQEIHVHVDTNMSWITNVIWNNNKMVSEHEIFYVINIMLLKSETFLAFPLENTKKKIPNRTCILPPIFLPPPPFL